MIKFDVHNRFTGAVQFTADIDCAQDAPNNLKLGLAVKWAIKTGVSLRGARLRGANLSGADLSDADLSGTDLHRADFRCADMTEVNLKGANLTDSQLQRADFRDVTLSGADLTDADLTGTDLYRVDLLDARLNGYILKRLIARIVRIYDCNEAQIYETKAGEIVGRWSCKTLTLAEFASQVDSYSIPDKRAESLNIVAYVRAEAERLGIGGPSPTPD